MMVGSPSMLGGGTLYKIVFFLDIVLLLPSVGEWNAVVEDANKVTRYASLQ
jgi:hypothetical protein